MSKWKKKEQQRIFNKVAREVSSHKLGLLELLLLNDERLLVHKVKKYLKKVRKGGIIIDAGCGTGAFMNQINHDMINTYHVIGIDLSFESIKIAKQKNERANFIVCDIEALPLKDKTFDMIIIRNVLHHLLTLEPLDNLIQLLNSNGIMLIDDKIRGNPLQEILTLAYPLMPYSFKMILREKGHHVDPYGHLPYIKGYGPKAYIKFINQYSNKLRIMEVEYHGFFLFLAVLGYLSYFFSGILNILTAPLLQKLYLLERCKLLRWSAISMTIVVAGI